MWIGLKLLASGALDAVLRGLSAAAKWLVSDWRHIPLTVLLGYFVVANWHLFPALKADLAASEKLVEATQLAHLGTISNFIDASAEAKAQAEANVARVTAEQEAISHEIANRSREDLAGVRERFARLRAADRLRAGDAARTDPGRADPAGLPAAGAAPGRAAGAPVDPDLRAARDLAPQPLCPPGLVCLTIDEAEAASEDAHRHNRLIDWVIAQAAVVFVPDEGQR